MMFWTTSHCLGVIIFIVAATTSAPAAASDSLAVSANAPAVSVKPRSPGRSFMELPTLAFEFKIRANCAGGRQPKSVFLNVADTRRSLTADQLERDGATELTLEVPADQLAPIAVEGFCTVTSGESVEAVGDAPTVLNVFSALSAQASLLCEGANDQAMTYVSRGLDVSLVCEPAAEDMESASE